MTPVSVAPGAARRLPWILLSLLIAGAAAFSLFYVGQRYWLDDSFISFRYARNLVEGHGLVYNPGDRVEGYSNFLWTLLAALALWLRLDPLHFAQGLSVLAQAGTLFLLHRLGRVAGRTPGRALLAPLLLLTSLGFLAYPMTGMETSFVTFGVTLGAWLLLEPPLTRRRALLIGLVLLVLALTRIDGFGLAFLLLGAHLLVYRRLRALLPAGLLLLGGLTLYHAWRLSYYPTPAPNTVLAKTGFSGRRLWTGVFHVQAFATSARLFLPLAFLPFLLGRVSRPLAVAGLVVLGQVAYVIAAGGDWMPHFRFLLPVLPLLLLLAQEGLWILWGGIAPLARFAPLAAGVLLAFVLGVQSVPLVQGRALTDLSGKHFEPGAAGLIGRHLEETFPQDALIAIEWGGILPYFVHHRVLDRYGLTDRQITESDFPKTVWGRKVPLGYLVRREPDLIVGCARLFPTAAAARRSVEAGGDCHYSDYPRLLRGSWPYRLEIRQVGPSAFWPAIVRAGRP